MNHNIIQINRGVIDVYNMLGKYVLYLNNKSISAGTLKNYVMTINNFLEYRDIEISPRKFKLKVRMPKVIRKNKEALSKEDIVDILNACSDIRLKTFVMFLAAGGFRAVEALSVRIKDLDLESIPPRVFIRGEYTKTRTDRDESTNKILAKLQVSKKSMLQRRSEERTRQTKDSHRI
ncbi:MAG: tyrosine-type recombinase/integrase [Candidatus Nitrosopolaris sp.]